MILKCRLNQRTTVYSRNSCRTRSNNKIWCFDKCYCVLLHTFVFNPLLCFWSFAYPYKLVDILLSSVCWKQGTARENYSSGAATCFSFSWQIITLLWTAYFRWICWRVREKNAVSGNCCNIFTPIIILLILNHLNVSIVLVGFFIVWVRIVWSSKDLSSLWSCCELSFWDSWVMMLLFLTNVLLGIKIAF